MNRWRSIFANNLSFFLPYLLFLVAGGLLQVFYSQTDLFLFLNSRYTPLGDLFFTYWTHLGDGLFALLMALLMALFYHYKGALIAFCVYAFSGLSAQWLKLMVFADQPRPSTFFENTPHKVHLIEGVEVLCCNSFPSGHTATAFAICCLLSLYFNKKYLGGVFFCIALMVGYSRIYLSQHFFGDVYAGSILGTLTALLFYGVFDRFKERNWHSRSVLSLWNTRKQPPLS
jgi:membrane-associated phospholipid phosphatase